MSVGAVWCGPMADGRYYESPVWHDGDAHGEDWTWFVCLDEDDPPELVWKEGTGRGPELPWIRGYRNTRYASGRTLTLGKSTRAHSANVRIVGHPPVPTKFDAVVDTIKDIRSCAYTLIRLGDPDGDH